MIETNDIRRLRPRIQGLDPVWNCHRPEALLIRESTSALPRCFASSVSAKEAETEETEGSKFPYASPPYSGCRDPIEPKGMTSFRIFGSEIYGMMKGLAVQSNLLLMHSSDPPCRLPT